MSTAFAIVRHNDQKLVVEYKCSYKTGRQNKSERFSLPWPHQDKRIYLHVVNGHNVDAHVRFDGMADLPQNLQYKLHFVKTGQVVAEYEYEHFARGSSLRGVLNPSEYRDEGKCVTVRFTAMNPKAPANEFADETHDDMEPGEQSQITLNVDGQQMFVIKQIVARRSPVFMAMLESKMLEGNTNSVAINDITYEVMREFYEFLRNGRIKFDNLSMAAELIYVADKYEVLKLLQFAKTYIKSYLAVENVLDALVLADRHAIKDLEKLALELAGKHKKKVLKSEGYKQFLENQSAAYKLLGHVMGN